MRARGLFVATSLLLASCSSDDTTAGIPDQGAPAPSAASQPGNAVLEEDSPGLLAQATISDAAARAMALERFPNGQIVEAEIDEDAGRVMYKYQLRVVSDRRRVDVDIDAKTGAIVAVDEDDMDDAEDEETDARLDTKTAPDPAPAPGSLRPARQRARVFIASSRS
ncbi:MAG TPA: PepSY domain-containing protein [Gemmatimonadales bacterium]|nr:PepSY domain-containing protein [Gemmatimonadales bacterium]